MSVDGLRWLVVETEHREETIAEANAAEAGFPTFLPFRRLKDGEITFLFDGYLFVRAYPDDEQHWGKLVAKDQHDRPMLRGVVSVLRSAGSSRPWCVPLLQWEALRALVGPLKVFDPWPRAKRQTHSYRKGDIVRVISGLMHDPYGVIERIGTVDWTEKDSIRVIGDCFGALAGVTLPASQVELLTAEVGGDRLAGGSLLQASEYRNRRGMHRA